MSKWKSVIEKKIQQAQEEGKFDNLPGEGKPLNLTENPHEDPAMRTANHLLSNSGFAPAWIEDRQGINAGLEQAVAALERGWQWYQRAVAREGRQAWVDAEWARTLAVFRERAEALNKQIDTHNLQVPSLQLEILRIDPERIIERVQKTPPEEVRP